MKNLFGLLAGLAVLAPAAARADGWCPPGAPPYRVEAGANIHFRVVPQQPPPQLAPWYTYWPAEAFQQAPAPAGNYPYWPAQPYGPNGGPTMHMPTPGGPTMHMPTPGPTSGLAMPPSGYQPTGYSQAPSYWYPKQ